MAGKQQISIPTPCHENWQDMTVAVRGRFCASCQKHVVDFTQSSDRQIAEVLKKESNVCGRFLNLQLERDLVIPEEKSSLCIAASAAVMAFFTEGSNEVFAQDAKVETVQVEKNTTLKPIDSLGNKRIITGVVKDITGTPIPGVLVRNVEADKDIHTDFDGLFAIEAGKKTILQLTFVGMQTATITVNDLNSYEVIMSDYENHEIITAGYVIYRRSFFGRIFYSISNIFR